MINIKLPALWLQDAGCRVQVTGCRVQGAGSVGVGDE